MKANSCALLGAILLIACSPATPRADTGDAATGPATSAEEVSVLPAAPPMPPEVLAAIDAMRKKRGAGYRPRTRHLLADGSAKFTNRLFLESSPYLLQHAHNPVNWYPWGDAAFAEARRRGVPVLLSIGYSTCHWCHVMEEESFEDLEIAGYINGNYVAIKVDREERPDVDAIYMSAVQALTGGGGWPMTVWLDPDRRPFYGGTYFPARDGDRGARAGFLTILRSLRDTYASDPERVAQAATEIVAMLGARLAPAGATETPDASVLDGAFAAYRGAYDSVNGGLSGAPKFPSSLPIRFLLRQHRRDGTSAALAMASQTLEKMAAGGMYDQVGGGFHRYATDATWLVPHFEKMLYDNALLAIAYVEGYQATGNEELRRVAEEILRYAKRDMLAPEGAFYSATDADSIGPSGHREEGWFFTWTPAELDQALGKEGARAVVAYYGVTAAGNFEGRSILHVPRPIEDVARDLHTEPAKLRARLDEAREALYAVRRGRPAPLRDEKILTAWNGLMISAFARAGLALAVPDHVRTAETAAHFVLDHLRIDGRLRRSHSDGSARHAAYLDDYAFLCAGLLDLFEASGDPSWLAQAIDLDRVVAQHYEDAESGGFFMTADDAEKLLTREKPAYDGAEPSGSSVHVLNLLRLHELTTDDHYRERAVRALGAFGATLARSPTALSEMLLALDFHLDRPREIVIVTAGDPAGAEPFLAELRASFVPNRVLVVTAGGKALGDLAKLCPLVEGKKAIGGKATAYVCEHGTCKLPTSDPATFGKQLQLP